MAEVVRSSVSIEYQAGETEDLGPPAIVLERDSIKPPYGTGKNAQSIEKPIDTITTRDRFGLVSSSSDNCALDIRYRMLQPHELAAAQGFPAGYHFCGTKTEKIKQIGNAVPVKTAEALCRALLN